MTPAAAMPEQEWWRPAVAVPAFEAVLDSQRSRVAFNALLVFMFVLLISPQSYVPAFGALHVAAISGAVAIYAHVAYASRHRQSIFAHHSSLRWAFLLAVWALATVPFSYWPGGSVELLFGLYFKSLIIFWLLGAIVDTRVRLKRMMTLMTILTVPIAVTAVIHYLNGTFVEGGDPSAPRIEGYDAPLTANPNDLALVMCMLLPMALALAATATQLRGRLAFLGIACLDLVAVVVTFSRTGFLTLGALLAFGVTRILRGPARTTAVVTIVLALGAVPFLPGGYLSHMETITAIDTDPTGSAQSRWSDSVLAAKLVLESPFVGAGAGMSVLALNAARGPSWVPVHNVYLEYATDLGIPGLVLFVLVLLACVRGVNRVVREARAERATELYCLAAGVQLTFVAFVVAGFFHPVAYHFHFYYAAGLATALAVVWENEHVRTA